MLFEMALARVGEAGQRTADDAGHGEHGHEEEEKHAKVVVAAPWWLVVQFLRDLAGGLVLTFEQPFRIGSRVRIAGHEGTVRRIRLRAFEPATGEGQKVVVPDAEVLRQAVAATAPEAREAPVAVELVVPRSVDADIARQVAHEAAYASP